MDPAGYLFSFQGLLLGLALANVATGFGDMWRDRRDIDVGVCAPLLAFVVMLGCMNNWLTFWRYREAAAVDVWHMLGACGVALPFNVVSRVMFPNPRSADTLEDHYLRHRVMILTALTVSAVASALSTLVLNGGSYPGWRGPWNAARIALPFGLIFVSSATAQRAGLAGLIALMVIGLFR